MTDRYFNPGQIQYDDYEHDPLAGEFYVCSQLLDLVFIGSTLTIARHNRSECERVAREHHAKNTGDNNV